MLAFPHSIRIFVAVEPVDMRQSFNGLNPDISQTGKRPGVITAQVVGVKQSNVAETDARPSTDCERGSFQFAALGARQVVADFSGANSAATARCCSCANSIAGWG